MTNLTFHYQSESKQLIVDLTDTNLDIDALTSEQESMIDQAIINHINDNLLDVIGDAEIDIIYSKSI